MAKKLVSWLLTLALLLGCVSLAAADGVTGETEEVVIDGNDPMKIKRERFFEENLRSKDGLLPSQKILKVIEEAIS